MTTASVVSRALAAGGLDRASRFDSFYGYANDGFIVKQGPQYGGDVVVMFTRRYDKGRKDFDRALEILAAAGFDAAPSGRPGVGGTYTIKVK